MSADTKVIYVGLGNAAVLVALILAVYFSDIPAVFMGGGEAVHESYSYWTFMLGAFVCAFILAPIPGAVLMRRAKVKHAILISVFSELELFLLMILVLRFFRGVLLGRGCSGHLFSHSLLILWATFCLAYGELHFGGDYLQPAA